MEIRHIPFASYRRSLVDYINRPLTLKNFVTSASRIHRIQTAGCDKPRQLLDRKEFEIVDRGGAPLLWDRIGVRYRHLWVPKIGA
jgi:hypothetical protein